MTRWEIRNNARAGDEDWGNRLAFRRNSHAIAWADWANGSWNGIRKMEASAKRRRILALWLPRFSTDRLTRLIARLGPFRIKKASRPKRRWWSPGAPTTRCMFMP